MNAGGLLKRHSRLVNDTVISTLGERLSLRSDYSSPYAQATTQKSLTRSPPGATAIDTGYPIHISCVNFRASLSAATLGCSQDLHQAFYQTDKAGPSFLGIHRTRNIAEQQDTVSAK